MEDMEDIELLKRTLIRIEQHYESDMANCYAYKNHIRATEPHVYSIEIDVQGIFKKKFTVSVTDKTNMTATIRDIKCPWCAARKILKRMKILKVKYSKYSHRKEIEKDRELRIKNKNIIIETVVDPVEEAFFKDDIT